MTSGDHEVHSEECDQQKFVLIVFFLDTFGGEGVKRILTPFTAVLMLLATVAIWVAPSAQDAIFGGMYVNDTACKAMKCILNIGVFLVLLQSFKWADSQEMSVRKGEYYELLLVTLFGMYLMISARHFLLFIIGLESAVNGVRILFTPSPPKVSRKNTMRKIPNTISSGNIDPNCE